MTRQSPDNVAVAEALLNGVKGTSAWTVDGAWRDEAFAAECVLQGDGERFTAVLLAPHMRLATLAIEKPHTLHWERVPQIPSSLDPEYVMLDLALTILPTDVLANVLDGSYRVDETPDGKRRTVVDTIRNRFHSVRQILPSGDIYFRNAIHGYEFTVKVVPDAD